MVGVRNHLMNLKNALQLIPLPQLAKTQIAEPKESTEPDALGMLRSWSSSGHSEEMRKQMLDDKFVIKDMAILGQMTALYAAPNCGKDITSPLQA